MRADLTIAKLGRAMRALGVVALLVPSAAWPISLDQLLALPLERLVELKFDSTAPTPDGAVAAGALLAALAWRLGADVAAELQLPAGRARTLAVGTGAVAGLLGPLVVFGTLPDSTALFAAISLATCLVITRLAAAWSRRHEFEADAFAALHSDGPELARALVRMYKDNASTLTPDPLYSAFHDSHPPPAARIERLLPKPTATTA